MFHRNFLDNSCKHTGCVSLGPCTRAYMCLRVPTHGGAGRVGLWCLLSVTVCDRGGGVPSFMYVYIPTCVSVCMCKRECHGPSASGRRSSRANEFYGRHTVRRLRSLRRPTQVGFSTATRGRGRSPPTGPKGPSGVLYPCPPPLSFPGEPSSRPNPFPT